MQYLLSEEEYQALFNRVKLEKETLYKTLLDLCQQVAENKPIKRRWNPDNEPDTPWGCILSKDEELNSIYCDECPVGKVCPYLGKDYSK